MFLSVTHASYRGFMLASMRLYGGRSSGGVQDIGYTLVMSVVHLLFDVWIREIVSSCGKKQRQLPFLQLPKEVGGRLHVWHDTETNYSGSQTKYFASHAAASSKYIELDEQVCRYTHNKYEHTPSHPPPLSGADFSLFCAPCQGEFLFCLATVAAYMESPHYLMDIINCKNGRDLSSCWPSHTTTESLCQLCLGGLLAEGRDPSLRLRDPLPLRHR